MRRSEERRLLTLRTAREGYSSETAMGTQGKRMNQRSRLERRLQAGLPAPQGLKSLPGGVKLTLNWRCASEAIA